LIKNILKKDELTDVEIKTNYNKSIDELYYEFQF